MPLSEFWDDDPRLFFSYIKAFENSQKRLMDNNDTFAWLSGAYVNKAIASNLSNKVKFPEKPFSMGKKQEDNLTEEDKVKALHTKFLLWAKSVNRKHRG